MHPVDVYQIILVCIAQCCNFLPECLDVALRRDCRPCLLLFLYAVATVPSRRHRRNGTVEKKLRVPSRQYCNFKATVHRQPFGSLYLPKATEVYRRLPKADVGDVVRRRQGGSRGGGVRALGEKFTTP